MRDAQTPREGVDAVISCEERDEEGNGGNGMKHLLIDFDSKIPNLALMKIAAWAKARGDCENWNESHI